MSSSAISRNAATLLISAGFLITELQLYPGYRSDSHALVNLGLLLAVLFASFTAMILLFLWTGHEAGGGVSAIVAGFLLFVLFLRTSDPAYDLPPVLVFSGGLVGVQAYASRDPHRNRAPPATMQAR